MMSVNLYSDKELTKKRIMRSFNLAANAYTQKALLQMHVGHELLCQLKAMSLTAVEYLVDVGAGTGYFSECLQQHYSDSQVVSLDIALAMLQQTTANKVQKLNADFDNMPLRDGQVDVIFSNLALQWSLDFDATLQEVLRVLKPGACFACSLVGENSLAELKSVWQQVDTYQHANQQLSDNNVAKKLERAGFSHIKVTKKTITLYYDDVKALLLSLKEIGTSTVLKGQRLGLMGKKRFQQFIDAYESYRHRNGQLPLSYEIIYIFCHKRD